MRAGDGRDVLVAAFLPAVPAFGARFRLREFRDAERVARLSQRFGAAVVPEDPEVSAISCTR